MVVRVSNLVANQLMFSFLKIFSPTGPDIGEMSFGGLNPDTRTPITIILEARDVAGNVIETINRRVRLG